MASEILYDVLQVLFGAVLVIGQACDMYPWVHWVWQNVISRCPAAAHQSIQQLRIFALQAVKIIQDYRSGIFYKPLRRREPVVIRSQSSIQELSEAPELSQRAVYADIFGFRHTMSKGEAQWDPKETNIFRYRLFARAIRINGLSQMEDLYPYLHKRLLSTFDDMVGPQCKGNSWTRLHITPVMQDLATGMLGVYHFGETLCKEPDFLAAMTRYYDDTVACMGAFQVVPTMLQSSIHSLITRGGHAMTVLFDRLHRAASPGVDGWDESSSMKRLTLFDNMLLASAESSYWTPTLVIQALLGIWFAASHQPWINLHFAFLELCARPADAELLRHEIQAAGPLDYKKIMQLPLLDSFIKESIRSNPLDKMGIRRKALKPYNFANGGPHVAAGEIACVPAWEFMHNPAKYPEPDAFDPLRFVPISHDALKGGPENPLRGTTVTDASKDFPIWGLGSKVCQGRWHAALVIKMSLAHLIEHYEFRLEASYNSYRWFWETFQMPYKSSHVMIKKRDASSWGKT